jgi:hypothetical protein
MALCRPDLENFALGSLCCFAYPTRAAGMRHRCEPDFKPLKQPERGAEQIPLVGGDRSQNKCRVLSLYTKSVIRKQNRVSMQ